MSFRRRVSVRAGLALGIAAALYSNAEAAPISLSTSYSQNFNGLALSGTTNPWSNDTTIAGWFAVQSDPTNGPNIATYRADNGTSTTGALYSYGTTSATDRAFGSLRSGSTDTISYGAWFTNDTANPITSLQISYTGEQWRKSGATIQGSLAFSYRTDATTTFVPSDTIPEASFTAFTPLTFNAPIFTATGAALDGNDALNKVVFNNVTLTGVSLTPGQSLWLRWDHVDISGSDHGLAIDDFTITPTFSTGGGSPVISASGTGVFGNLLLGSTATMNVTLTNTGTADTTGLAATGTGTGITFAAPLSTTLSTTGAGATTTAAVTIDTSTTGSITGSATYTAQPGSVVSTPAISISASVNTATYGTQMTAATPLTYVTPSIGLTSTGNGTAGSGNPPALNSTAKITNYTNSSGTDTAVNMTWRLRTADEASNVSGLNDNGNLKSGYLISDVVNITGMDNGNGITDTFVLTMSYNAALLNGHEDLGIANGTIFIGWKNGSNEWVNAVFGNNNATGTGSYQGDTDFVAGVNVLGDYGIDKSTSTVWAVLNHNSEFAVIPEPSTMVLGGIAMLGFAGMGLRRRRQKPV